LKTNNYIDEKDIGDINVKIFPRGAIIFPKIGMVINLNKKRILGVEGTVDNNMMVLIPKDELCNNEFLYQYFIGKIDLREIADRTTLPYIKKSTVEDIIIKIPPLGEQHGIAEVLGTVDEAIRRTDDIIAKAEELKSGLMQRLLTQGIGHTEFKQTELGEIPVTREISNFEKIFKLSSGEPRPKEVSAVKDFINNTPIYGGNGILGWTNRSNINENVIVIGRVGEYCGAVHLVKEKIWITDNALYTKNFYQVNNLDYIYFLLTFLQLNKFSKRSGQPLITQSIINNIKIALPSLAEQEAISNILMESESNIRIEKRKKESLKKIKVGLMQILLSGRVRVELREDGLHRIDDS